VVTLGHRDVDELGLLEQWRYVLDKSMKLQQLVLKPLLLSSRNDTCNYKHTTQINTIISSKKAW
jgi:hypothetical protein